MEDLFFLQSKLGRIWVKYGRKVNFVKLVGTLYHWNLMVAVCLQFVAQVSSVRISVIFDVFVVVNSIP